MAVIIKLRRSMEDFIQRLSKDFPGLSFCAGKSFSWSPSNCQIIYKAQATLTSPCKWAILHELGHALLEHFSYASDFELLKLEVAAWHRAQTIAPTYSENISEDHIQNCLDTYREWLH